MTVAKKSIHQWTVHVILMNGEAFSPSVGFLSGQVKIQSINGLCLWFWRVLKHFIHQMSVYTSFLKFNPSVDWHVWFLARIQSISGLNKWFFHNPSVDCTTIFANVQICTPLMDCASPFFCQIREKNTPLNANDENLFLPLFFHFFLHLKCHQLPNF